MKTTNPPTVTTVIREIGIDRYQGFVERHPDSTVFHHRNWIELLCEQHGLQYHILAVQENDQIVAAVPFLETKTLLGKRKLISLPFTDSVAVLADAKQFSQLKQRLQSDQYSQYDSIVLRTHDPSELGRSDDAWIRHTIDLTRPWDQIYRSFDRRLRTNLRRAEKARLCFRCSTSVEAMERFFNLQLKTRRKIGVPVQPQRFFELLRKRMLEDDLGFVGLVECEGKTIAAGVFLVYNGTLMYKYSAADPDFLGRRPNEFLTHESIKCGIDFGCHTFDFGISKQGQEGLRRFKRKFGSTEAPVYREFVTGEKRELPEDTKAMAVASALIKSSPEFVCKMLGEVFYKYSQ